MAGEDDVQENHCMYVCSYPAGTMGERKAWGLMCAPTPERHVGVRTLPYFVGIKEVAHFPPWVTNFSVGHSLHDFPKDSC